MALDLINVEPAESGDGLIFVFDDGGRERRCAVSGLAMDVLTMFAIKNRIERGEMLTIDNATLLLRPPVAQGGKPMLGVRTAQLGDVLFTLSWLDLNGLAQSAQALLELSPSEGRS